MALLDNPTIHWPGGGDAEVVAVTGVQVTLRSTRPFPPGTPASGSITGDLLRGFTLKVAASRRLAEGVWEIRGRLVTAPTDLLGAFAAAVRPAQPG